jgi:nucleoid-associated protein YgaU
LEVARLTEAKGIHTVKRGDTLSALAATFYNQRNRWPDILAANRYFLGDNPDLILPGMVLVIPQ